jgi:hypothetical protein
MIELTPSNQPIRIKGIALNNYRIEYDGNIKGIFKIFSKVISAN